MVHSEGLIDEIQQLQGHHYQQIGKMFLASERRVVLLLTGDKWQIIGFGTERIWHTTMWRNAEVTFKLEVHHVFWCKDPKLAAILNELLTNPPSHETLDILQAPERIAWFGA